MRRRRSKQDMKRFGNLFERIIDIDNIKLAHKNARKGKTHYTEVKMVDADVEKYCLQIKEQLGAKTFTTSEYERFIKHDKGKTREIYKLPYFPDRIVQHALMQIVEPIWRGTLIADTYQSIKGRGIHKCLPKVKYAVQADKVKYYMQLDVKKFYPSINNEIMKTIVRRKIKCKDTLWLVDDIIDSCDGIPIGNYVSQYLGNMYLSKLDHIMKENQRVKHYYRYCDDILILHDDKHYLHKLLLVVKKELSDVGLKLKDNYSINKITNKDGIDFLGYVTYPQKTLIRKTIKRNAIKKYSNKNYHSYDGWLLHCNGHNLQRTLRRINT